MRNYRVIATVEHEDSVVFPVARYMDVPYCMDARLTLFVDARNREAAKGLAMLAAANATGAKINHITIESIDFTPGTSDSAIAGL